MTTTTQTKGYYEATVTTVDCDENPAQIEVCVSPDEWAGVNLSITAQGTVISVLGGNGDLADALDQARQLRDALDEAIRYAEAHAA